MNTYLTFLLSLCALFSLSLSLFQHTGLYPIASKGMRLIAQGKDPLEGQKHMCGMGNMYNYHSTGYPELDELMRMPQPLIFILELIEVGTYPEKTSATHIRIPPSHLCLSILNIPLLQPLAKSQNNSGSVQPTVHKPLKPESKQNVMYYH